MLDPPRADPRVLRQIWPFLRPRKLAMLGVGVALTVAGLSVLALGQGLRRLVDSGLTQGEPGLWDAALIGLLVIAGLLAAATYARFFLVSWLGERLAADMRVAVYNHLLRLDPAFFEVTATGELSSRLITDTTLLQTIIGSTLSAALRNLLLLTGGLVMLTITSPKLAGLILLVVPCLVIPLVMLGRKVRRLSRRTHAGLAAVTTYADESIAHIATIQAFVHEPLDRRRFARHTAEAFTLAIDQVRVRALLTALVMILAFSAISLVLWVGGGDMLAGHISPGDLSAFLFYAALVAAALGALSETYGDLQRAAGAAERLLELLAARPQIGAPAQPARLPTPVRGEVRFESVGFYYPSRTDQSALTDFTLTLSPGERVALVGPSGAGKSTVLQLLMRFYDPDHGRITLDGIDLRQLDPAVLRRHIAVVPQAPVMFSDSARENIRYGRPDASDGAVVAAARQAAIDDFITGLPGGYDSFLGQKGARLSGGQRQRIAIARAILKDPPILLLDEATSALDAESEHAVRMALDRLMAGRTSLVIAHRLATVCDADRIVVMDKGRIVATGTHEALVAQGGLYARLAALQLVGGEAMVEPDLS